MRSLIRCSFAATTCLVALAAQTPSPQRSLDPGAAPPMVRVLTTDGRDIEGRIAGAGATFEIDGAERRIAWTELLAFHSARPATSSESARIARDLDALSGSDRALAETARAELIDIGMPVLTPLLASYADTDAHEPDPRYRLFGQILPGHADRADRSLDLLRLDDDRVLRGHWRPADLEILGPDGKPSIVAAGDVRRVAVRRARIEKTFDLDALHHCTYVGFLDTGIVVDAASALTVDATGFVRLSFDEDGWATDPDGIHDPLPGKRRLQEGFRWGAVLGRVGPSGARWFAGRHTERSDLADGRLFFVVNDNEHWQNNIGSYRVRLTVTDAYDVGEAR